MSGNLIIDGTIKGTVSSAGGKLITDSNTDFNNLITYNKYQIQAVNLLNMPTPTYGGKLIVEAYHWGYIQIYIPDSPENHMYIRKLYTYDNNEWEWTNWEQLLLEQKTEH